MAELYLSGQTLQRGDLEIKFQDAGGDPVNVYQITYALYFVDPNTQAEILIGSATRIPINPQVGEYYAALMIPPSANVGSYRIRWFILDTAGAAQRTVVMQFSVVEKGNQIVTYSSERSRLIRRLRLLLRDQCIAGEEELLLDVSGIQMRVSIEDLWGATHSALLLTNQEKQELKEAFEEGTLRIQSVSPEGSVQWKRVVEVMRSEVPWESLQEIKTEKGPLIITGGHRVFLSPTEKMEAEKLCEGQEVLGIQNGKAVSPKILSREDSPSRQYMYDLTAEDWHNFVVERSGIVISNSPDKFYHFRPPEHEGRIGSFNRVFGQIWEDEELNEYLETALDWWNMMPPRTRELCSIEQLLSTEPAWSHAIIWRAIVHAMLALTLNWAADEFSLDKGSMVRVVLESGEGVDIPIGELYELQVGYSTFNLK